MLRKFIAASVIALLPAMALAAPKQGDWEVKLNGAGANNNAFDAGTFSVGGSVGYFLTKEFEVSLRQTVAYSDFNAGTNWNFATTVGGDFHFDLGVWQPYIGANIGYVWGDTISDTWEIAPEAGVKYFVHDRVFVYGQMEYQWFWNSSDDEFSDGQAIYSLGIGFLLP